VLAGVLIAAMCGTKGGLTNELTVMVVTLAFFGFACGEIGKRIPWLGKMGAAAICATFIPSALVYYHVLPDVVVDTTTNQVSQGNPNLKPLHSRNFDISAEYYLPGQGIIALSAFYKDIDDPIYASTVTQSGSFGGYTLTGAAVSSYFNAGSGEIKGLEINLSDQFTFLPAPFDGLGASANLAVIDSKANGLPGRTDVLPLAQQSKYVSTLQLFYEKEGFTARLAYSYRSKWLDAMGSSKDGDQYTMANGQLDARVSYDIADNFTVFTEGANLNGARWRRYIGSSNQAYESERYSWSLRTGIQIKF